MALSRHTSLPGGGAAPASAAHVPAAPAVPPAPHVSALAVSAAAAAAASDLAAELGLGPVAAPGLGPLDQQQPFHQPQPSTAVTAPAAAAVDEEADTCSISSPLPQAPHGLAGGVLLWPRQGEAPGHALPQPLQPTLGASAAIRAGDVEAEAAQRRGAAAAVLAAMGREQKAQFLQRLQQLRPELSGLAGSLLTSLTAPQAKHMAQQAGDDGTAGMDAAPAAGWPVAAVAQEHELLSQAAAAAAAGGIAGWQLGLGSLPLAAALATPPGARTGLTPPRLSAGAAAALLASPQPLLNLFSP